MALWAGGPADLQIGTRGGHLQTPPILAAYHKSHLFV